jgi:hypothetical protein
MYASVRAVNFQRSQIAVAQKTIFIFSHALYIIKRTLPNNCSAKLFHIQEYIIKRRTIKILSVRIRQIKLSNEQINCTTYAKVTSPENISKPKEREF